MRMWLENSNVDSKVRGFMSMVWKGMKKMNKTCMGVWVCKKDERETRGRKSRPSVNVLA